MWWPAFGAHNLALAALLEGGLIGGALLGGAAVVVASRARRKIELVAVLVAIGVNGITEGLIERPRVTLLAFAAVAAAASPAARVAARDVRQLRDLRPTRWALAALTTSVVVAGAAAGTIRVFGGGPAARARLVVNSDSTSYLVAADRARLTLSALDVGPDARVSIDVPEGQNVVDVTVSGVEPSAAAGLARDIADRLAEADRVRLVSPLTRRENALAEMLATAENDLAIAERLPEPEREQALSAVTARVNEIRGQLAAAVIDRRTFEPELESVGLVASNGGKIPNEVLAGMGAGYLALLASIVVGRRIRSRMVRPLVR